MRKFIEKLIGHLPGNSVQVALTALYGVGAGLASVAFLLATNLLFSSLFLSHQGAPPWHFILHSFFVVMGSSLLVGLILHFGCPTAAGSGIPQLKAAYWKDLGFIPFKAVWVKFATGIISIGGGASLGREGPSVFVGGGVASSLAGLTGQAKQSRREATMIGASAALAAAFNTPLAAITFVLEELIGNLNSRFLGKVVLAAVFGAFTVHALVGRQPAFDLPMVTASSWTIYPLTPIVAAVAAGLGLIFQNAAISWRARIRKDRRTPAWIKPMVGGLITWLVGSAVFFSVNRVGVYGLGYQDLTAALMGSLAWKLALLLIAAKLIATIACYSWGGSGGIFAPTLFLGGLSGACIAGIAGIWLPLSPGDTTILAAAGMSACFGAVVRAPLTALLIVFEMTHQFELIPVLMITTIVSQAMARLNGKHNFYDALLLQDGHDLTRLNPPSDITTWRKLPVSTIASLKPVLLPDLSPATLRNYFQQWPFTCFPVFLDGKLAGGVTREEALAALKHGHIPKLESLATCSPDDSIHEVADKMVHASIHMAVMLSPEDGKVKGILTLHDILRAQAAVQE